MYKRIIEESIKKELFQGKIIIIYGPRQVGKTTLVKKLIIDSEDYVYFDCQIENNHDFLVPNPEVIKSKIGGAKLLVLDEAQYVPEIGRVLKVFHDAYPEVQIIVTGSSSFDLANKTSESLAGRTREYTLFPISVEEMVNQGGVINFESNLPNIMRYGLYPGILNVGEDKKRQDLETLQSAVLYRDILALEGVSKPKLLVNLLKSLALMVGSEVSNSYLAKILDTSVVTVDRYVDILEKMFIIRRLYSLSRNPGVEIKKGYKIYFLDLGIRNSIIQNHNSLEIRNDTGALFENHFVIERIKFLKNHNVGANMYFWRTIDQKEIDLIEERDGYLTGYECSVEQKSIRVSKERFLSLYPDSKIENVTKDKSIKFLT